MFPVDYGQLFTARDKQLIILCLVGDARHRVASRKMHNKAQSDPASAFAFKREPGTIL